MSSSKGGIIKEHWAVQYLGVWKISWWLVMDWRNQENVAAQGNLLEMKYLELHLKPIESKFLDVVMQGMG